MSARRQGRRPRNVLLEWGRLQVENRDIILGLPPARRRRPNPNARGIRGVACNFGARNRGLVNRDDFLIRDQRACEVVQLREIGPQDHRRPRHRPQRELRSLLLLRDARLPRLSPPRVRRQRSPRQHVRVGPVAGLRVFRPLRQIVESAEYSVGKRARPEIPSIPNVVGNPPHLRILRHFRRMAQVRRTGREAQHHRPVRPLYRLGDHANLGPLVGVVRNAIHLQEIHSPLCVEPDHRVVERLARRRVADAVIAVIPRAQVGLIGCLGRVKAGVSHRQVRVGHPFGNAPHQVYAEFQPQRMRPIGQRFEPRAARRGREAHRVWNQASIRVPGRLPRLGPRLRVYEVPAFVDHRIVPAVTLQTREHLRARAELRLVNREPVGVPTVPPHGRRGGEFRRRRGNHRKTSQQQEGSQAANRHEKTLTTPIAAQCERRTATAPPSPAFPRRCARSPHSPACVRW